MLAIIVTMAGGLGLLVGGARPTDALHFVYAIVILSIGPLAVSLTRAMSLRWQGLVATATAVIALALLVRLFQTG
jgi:hypothetical protein